MSSASGDTIDVIVKDVYNGGKVDTVQMPVASCVSDLKRRLAERVDGGAATQDQRLIFCGKVLKDDDNIGSVLGDQTSALPASSQASAPDAVRSPTVLLVRKVAQRPRSASLAAAPPAPAERGFTEEGESPAGGPLQRHNSLPTRHEAAAAAPRLSPREAARRAALRRLDGSRASRGSPEESKCCAAAAPPTTPAAAPPATAAATPTTPLRPGEVCTLDPSSIPVIQALWLQQAETAALWQQAILMQQAAAQCRAALPSVLTADLAAPPVLAPDLPAAPTVPTTDRRPADPSPAPAPAPFPAGLRRRRAAPPPPRDAPPAAAEEPNGALEAAPLPPGGGGGGGGGGIRVVEALQLRLLVKLLFMLFLLGQGAPWRQQVGLMTAAAAIYLLQTGAVAFVVRRIVGAAREAEDGGGGGAVDGLGRVRALGRGFISVGGGWAMDAQYVLLTFLCSLLPAWQPRPFPGDEAQDYEGDARGGVAVRVGPAAEG